MLLPITLTLAAACALINLWLASRCVRIRMADKAALHGDGGNALLARRMRAHANFIEYTPMVLILSALIEMALGASLWLWIGALAYVLARLCHGLGMDAEGGSPLRAIGALLTWFILTALACAALYAAYQGTRGWPVPPAMAAL
ncbi:MAPEG family protein [Sphingobium cloacae]|uniref:GST-related protein n=1 Tax=Sphingobium cloacae TaxID=120107 RepID=A0A1E1F726_9SPHN|nr:MAPEG family protein [Sphingobium cloacae]BAV66287.1 GST-related protein [Sphingobium cloacae]